VPWRPAFAPPRHIIGLATLRTRLNNVEDGVATFMVETAHFGHLHDLTHGWRLEGSGVPRQTVGTGWDVSAMATEPPSDTFGPGASVLPVLPTRRV